MCCLYGRRAVEEYYYEVPVNNSKVLCVGPITKQEAEVARADGSFCDGFGYYIFLADAVNKRADIEVLGKFVSETAVAQLVAALRGGRLAISN
jgi:hypothetical protein